MEFQHGELSQVEVHQQVNVASQLMMENVIVVTFVNKVESFAKRPIVTLHAEIRLRLQHW